MIIDAKALLRDAGTPGLAAIRIEGRNTEITVAGVGRAGGSPLNASQKFSVGSLSKSFTALLCARLVDRGRLKWTITLGEAWPGEVSDPALAKVTLIDLLRHRTGITGDWANYPKSFPESAFSLPVNEGRETLRRALLKAPFVEKARADAAYANANFVLAALLAERATGKSWPELVRQEVFRPLGIDRDARAGIAERTDGTVGHTRRKDGWRAEPGAGNPGLLWGADGVYLSPNGLARYLRAHLARSPRYLRPATWAVVHDPKEPLGLFPQPGRFPGPTTAWLWHNGSNTLNYGAFAFDPATGRAAAILVNGASPTAERTVELGLATLLRRSSNTKTDHRS